jgi:hypothetical protein
MWHCSSHGHDAKSKGFGGIDWPCAFELRRKENNPIV